MQNDIILGDGLININGTDIGLTRGGGKFSIEREYRQIEADGDFGPVKGRIRIVKSVAKLTLNALEMLKTNMTKFYPGMNFDTAGVTYDELSGNGMTISAGDYQDTVTWTGQTLDGRNVVITINNAINLEGIEWEMVDKEELVPEISYTATYAEDARTTEPWKIEFQKATTYSVTFTCLDNVTPVSGASISFNNQVKTTNGSGVAVFTGTEVANNQAYTVLAGGYNTILASVNVDGNEAVAVALTSI